MSDTQSYPVRQGRNVSFQLDYDAYELLNEMSTPRSRGAFLAGLLRKEWDQQEKRWERRNKARPKNENERVKERGRH